MPDPRTEVDAIQLVSLTRMIPSGGRGSFASRAMYRLKENFFGKPLKQKIQFTAFAGKWALRRAYAVANSRVNPRLRAVTRVHDDSMLRVATYGMGSIGDFINYATFLQRLQLEHGPMVIDFFSLKNTPGAAFVLNGARVRNVFGSMWFERIKHQYDVAILLHHMVRYDVFRPERVCQLAPKLANVIEESWSRYHEHSIYCEKHPMLDGMLGRLMTMQGRNRQRTLGYFSSIEMTDDLFLSPDASKYGVLADVGLDGRRYITIHDGYDVDYKAQNSNKRATKCWPVDHWAEFVRRFKAQYPDVMVVQIGAGNSAHTPGTDLDLIDKTSLHQAAWIIKHALLHVDGESGLVRMARALRTPSVVMIGPTDAKYFGFEANANIVAECNGCWWAKPDWLSFCVRGLTEPVCMRSITPDRVLEETGKCLANRRREYAYAASPVSLYDQQRLRETYAGRLANIFNRTGLRPVPITSHAKNDETGVYIHASKQWEYVYVLDRLPIGPGLKIADLGGGRGALSLYLASMGHSVDIMDLDYLWDHGGDLAIEHRFIRFARRMGANPGYASIFNVPADDNTYDAVVSISVMEHLPYKQYALREALRVLKPGGVLVMTFDFSLDPSGIEDDLRKEILTPSRLDHLLRVLGTGAGPLSETDVTASIDEIHRDGVLGIPDGMTVGGIVIRKC